MFENILVIIPCRAGSQRFIHKNTALFQGVPLVSNTINIAREAGLNNILVSTDDINVMGLCNKVDVRCIDRPIHLTGLDAKSEDVAEDVVRRVEELDLKFNTLCLMQVTSPLLQAATLNTAVKLYSAQKLNSLTAVDSRYQPVGAFYIVDAPSFAMLKSFYYPGGGLYVLPPEQCPDIDFEYQLSICGMIAEGKVWGL